MKQETFGGSGGEGMKDLYSRITADAVSVLNGMETLKPEVKRRAIALMQNADFRKKAKEGWDQDTLRGVRDPDHEVQERKWARGLAQRVLTEVSSESSAQ
ncbi:MAG: hypothetical protein UY16_C0040G0004 [Candidatus Gottesmanbacteria bacterium GW2011_GWA2_47_9]|uniref:Uncharacterized protein n=1 Tax=Candidatus Gottesmanbacteria bacterium GW2011_GWA2_47_9 TaxID=1618445 RepID=A0A0G1TZ05_9BACT|nr:MAG: hypothetical protein UY16_C0040G0004 [Candidatus Gottesmanbacteria bacterium GW2011_GWA2_47_9]